MKTLVEQAEAISEKADRVPYSCIAGAGDAQRGRGLAAGPLWIQRSHAGGWVQSFRRWALEQFEKEYPLHLIGGYTGSGKTDLLAALSHKGEAVLDLEGLAHHKGSAFGNIGQPEQPTQEQFENKMALALRKIIKAAPDRIWVEDESQRIGRVNIPGSFWQLMRRSIVHFLDIPFEKDWPT